MPTRLASGSSGGGDQEPRRGRFADGCRGLGGADAGKSNLIAAIRAVLDPEAAPLQASDQAEGGDGTISIRLGFAAGGEALLEGTPPQHSLDLPSTAPAVLFLRLIARGRSNREAAQQLFIAPKTVGRHVESP